MTEITTWLKLKEHFIDQKNVRSVSRQGKGTKITRIIGDEVFVDIPYDKVKELLPAISHQ